MSENKTCKKWTTQRYIYKNRNSNIFQTSVKTKMC